MKVQIWALKYFDFITEEMINDAVGDAEIVSSYVKRNFDFLYINIHEHRVMMKLNEVRKKELLGELYKEEEMAVYLNK